MSDAISNIFDVNPTPAAYTPPAVIVETSKADDDIEFARGNLKQLMGIAQDAIGEAMNLAINSETPRAYEVITGLINAASDLNSKLITSHQTQQKMKQDANGTPASPSVTNNSIIFTGTPAELARLMNKESNHE